MPRIADDAPNNFTLPHDYWRIYSKRAVELTNAYRKLRDPSLPDLHYSEDLTKIAMAHSKEMAKAGKLSHAGMSGRLRQWFNMNNSPDPHACKTGKCFFAAVRRRKGAENCVDVNIEKFYNFTDAPEKAVYSWKESPAHDKN
jgi:uncharacterized protein YkwD